MFENGRSQVRINEALGVGCTCLVLSLCATLLRVYSRCCFKFKFSWDDYFAVLAFFPYLICISLMFWGPTHGGSGGLIGLTFPQLSELAQTVLVFELAYAIGMLFLRLSVLALLRRVLPLPSLRLGSLVIGGLSFALAISAVFAMIFQCKPVRAIWDFTIPHNCIGQERLFVALNSIDLGLDIVTVLLPIPYVWQLKLSWTKRIGLVSIFSIGILASALSFPRIIVYSHYTFANAVENIFYSSLWSNAQFCAGVITINLPAIYPAFRIIHASRKSRAKSSGSSTVRSSMPLNTPAAWSPPRGFADLEKNLPPTPSVTTTEVSDDFDVETEAVGRF